MAARTDEGALGYEQARDELIEVVRRLEAGGTTLEESLALWERGEELAKVCRRWLDGARARLDAALTERGEPRGGAAPDAAGAGGGRDESDASG
ncbi:exodeoxyribonuclease VII small subunit [Streptomyces sp. NPDC059015]|uniref:exodeoxyribonuclease VII small subunit n=1 Tax=unclassified Streptomyces TaxID=2593676 RepID=UPI0036B15F11